MHLDANKNKKTRVDLPVVLVVDKVKNRGKKREEGVGERNDAN